MNQAVYDAAGMKICGSEELPGEADTAAAGASDARLLGGLFIYKIARRRGLRDRSE